MEENRSLTSSPIDRRSFLKLSGLLGLGLASAGILPAAAEAVKFDRAHHKVAKTQLGMGTFVSMTLIHPSKDEAEHAMGLAFGEIDRLTALLSRFHHASAVAQLNREGFVNDIPPELAEVLAKSLEYYRTTQGTFDISVKPLVDLFKESFSDGKNTEPSEAQIDQVLHRVGGNKIKMTGRSIRFSHPGMGITLDGIAKGFIVDRASHLLTTHGIKNHLINAGGDIRTSGSGKEGKPWTVAIEDPQKKQQFPDIIHLTDGAVATSGNYEIYFDRERMFHHIVDPFTGHSPSLATSVSVVAPTVMDADALSTSVFVLDPGRGTRFVDSLPNCECFIVTKAGEKLKSQGWKSVEA